MQLRQRRWAHILLGPLGIVGLLLQQGSTPNPECLLRTLNHNRLRAPVTAPRGATQRQQGRGNSKGGGRGGRWGAPCPPRTAPARQGAAPAPPPLRSCRVDKHQQSGNHTAVAQAAAAAAPSPLGASSATQRLLDHLARPVGGVCGGAVLGQLPQERLHKGPLEQHPHCRQRGGHVAQQCRGRLPHACGVWGAGWGWGASGGQVRRQKQALSMHSR